MFVKLNKKKRTPYSIRYFLFDATGFEPATSASRTQRSTKLSHASLISFSLTIVTLASLKVKENFMFFF